MELTSQELAWYCIQTAPRQERKVAAFLEREVKIETFAPKIRFRRIRLGEPLWATEALFPGYLFARFAYLQQRRQINALPGVGGIVQFGDQIVPIEDALISQLRSFVGDAQTIEITVGPAPGSEVVITGGPLRGFQVLVTRVMPARQRIAILLEMLGSPREVEIESDRVVAARPRRIA